MNSYKKLIEENFGMPLDYDEKLGKKIGDEYAGEPAVGVRDMRDDLVCAECGMMPVEDDCGCSDSCMCRQSNKNLDWQGVNADYNTEEFLSLDDESNLICPTCQMMMIDGACGCEQSQLQESDAVCKECGMRENVCECGMVESKKKHFPNLTKKQAKKRFSDVEKKKEAGKSLEKIFPWAEDPGAAFGALKAKAKK